MQHTETDRMKSVYAELAEIILPDLTIEQRLHGLTPKDRLRGLTEEERDQLREYMDREFDADGRRRDDAGRA